MIKAMATGSALLLILGAASVQAADSSQSQDQHAAASSQSSDQGQQGHPDKMNVRQNIQQTLSNNGYKDISVMPSSFLVHAKDKNGQPVVMVVGPDSVTAVTELKSDKHASAENNSNNTTTNNNQK